MGPLYAYSLLPVMSVSLLLFFTAIRSGRRALGLAMYCAAVAFWCGALWLACLPTTARIGQRLAASGAFVVASFVHVAYDATKQERYYLVWLGYVCAVAITLGGILFPGVLYDPATFRSGPLFWPGMVLSIGAASLPLWQLGRAYRTAPSDRRRFFRALFLSGLIGLLGAWANALLLSHRVVVPHGIYVVLGSMLLLAHAIRSEESPRERKMLERSLLYSGLAALLSAGFLFGVMQLVSQSAEPLLTQYRLGAFFLLVMAALAFEPLRQRLQEIVGKRLVRGSVVASDLVKALAHQENRANQAERLAELGVFTSAVAHEIRNPLGVLRAHCRVLEKKGVAPEVLDEMMSQVSRAEQFVEDLLRYGRPRPIDLRIIDVQATVELAVSTARAGLGSHSSVGEMNAIEVNVTFEPAHLMIEADQAQLLQVFIVLVDNSLLALRDAPTKRISICGVLRSGTLVVSVDDGGSGIPEGILPRLFEPFVSGRKRDKRRSGTGLGLAIARGIIERHGGTIRAGISPLGGARLEVALPRVQTLLSAAAGTSP